MQRHGRTWHRVGLGVGLTVSVVCSSCARPAGPPTYPVTGIVTIHDAPVEGAVVVFLPLSGDESALASQAITDGQGRFAMRTRIDNDRDQEGMPAGDYAVTVTKLEVVPDMRRQPKNLLPRKYSSAKTSPLVASVQSSVENDFRFSLD